MLSLLNDGVAKNRNKPNTARLPFSIGVDIYSHTKCSQTSGLKSYPFSGTPSFPLFVTALTAELGNQVCVRACIASKSGSPA